MSKFKSSNIVEKYCPVVGENVVIKVYNNDENSKSICLNDTGCELEDISCDYKSFDI